MRLLPPDELPIGWLSSPSSLPWTWFSISALVSPTSVPLSTTSSAEGGALSDIAETETPPPGQIDPPGLSAKAAGKRRSISAGASTKKRPTTPDDPPSPTRVSQAAGRISPLGGRISPSTSRVGRRYPSSGKDEEKHNVPEVDVDPHTHPAVVSAPGEPGSFVVCDPRKLMV